MTDLTTFTTFSIRRMHLARPRLSKLAIKGSLFATFTSITKAFSMAYVDPFAPMPKPMISDDTDLDGRDPNW